EQALAAEEELDPVVAFLGEIGAGDRPSGRGRGHRREAGEEQRDPQPLLHRAPSRPTGGRTSRIHSCTARATRSPEARIGKCSSNAMIRTTWFRNTRRKRPTPPISRMGSNCPYRISAGFSTR